MSYRGEFSVTHILMMTSEKFNLTWNEFEQSTSNAFKDLLDQQDFVDVTLVCEDSKEIKCHKVVLSASLFLISCILVKLRLLKMI